MSPTHTHKFRIADQDAVRTLLHKFVSPNGSSNVDRKKLMSALYLAMRRYKQSNEQVTQAFFHGLLTGYSVGLKYKPVRPARSRSVPED
jgi:hypothetical protein